MEKRNKSITTRHIGGALLAVATFVSFPQQTFAADRMVGAPSPGMGAMPGMGAGVKPRQGGMGVMAPHPTGAMNDDWKAPPRAARKANPVASVEKAIAIGKALYVAECFACHGREGKGDGPGAISLERDGKRIIPGNLSDPMMRQHTDGDLFWKISEGKSPMPAFAKRFSEGQRWQIVNYIRTLALEPRTQTGASQAPTAP